MWTSGKVGNIMLDISLTLCVLLLHGVSGADPERESVSVNEGDSVTLNTGVKINQKDRIKWFFDDTRIAQITGYISNCTDVQCNEGTERFRGRLKLDLQTGSLTIMNIRNTHSGEYKLQITSHISNTDTLKIFNVTVSAVPDSSLSPDVPDPGLLSGLSQAAVAGIVAAVALLAAAVIGGVIYCRKQKAGQEAGQNDTEQQDEHQENRVEDSSANPLMNNADNETPPNQNGTRKKNTCNGTPPNQNKIPLMNTANGTSSNPPEEETSL